MTRVIWDLIKEKLISPYVDLELHRYENVIYNFPHCRRFAISCFTRSLLDFVAERIVQDALPLFVLFVSQGF